VRRWAAALAVLLLSGCGLPLSDGVQSAGEVPGEQAEPAGIQVLPPGPQPGATAVDLVRGFLRAQSSPDEDHAVARQFLAPETAWDEEEFVIVYAPGSQTVRADPDDPGRVEVRLRATARIGADGSYRLLPSDTEVPPEQFQVQRGQDGELELTEVPPGLRITTADVSRSFVPSDVYLLGQGAEDEATPVLVPDRVFLPTTVEPATARVTALLTGASEALAPAVQTAVPPGTTLVSPVVVEDGVVTVDLSAQVRELSARDRERLSAQLVWTLQDQTGVRLLTDGEPLDVPGAGEVQTRDDWSGYDPGRLLRSAPLLYVQDRTVRSLDGPLEAGDATRQGSLEVDAVAISPMDGTLGVLTRRDGPDEVRIGPLQGSTGAPVLTREDIGSLSWGSGRRGLWVLERSDPRRVWVVPGPGASPDDQEQEVLVERPGGVGPLSSLAVSRDGARVALVFGQDDERQLFVGRVQPTAGGVRVADVVPVAPLLRNVTDVAWESGTSLVVIATDSSAAGLLTLTVAVDGSSVVPLQRQGVEGVPVSVAAAPGRQLVVEAVQEGQQPRLFLDNGVLFRPQAQGSAPAYPG